MCFEIWDEKCIRLCWCYDGLKRQRFVFVFFFYVLWNVSDSKTFLLKISWQNIPAVVREKCFSFKINKKGKFLPVFYIFCFFFSFLIGLPESNIYRGTEDELIFFFLFGNSLNKISRHLAKISIWKKKKEEIGYTIYLFLRAGKSAFFPFHSSKVEKENLTKNAHTVIINRST